MGRAACTFKESDVTRALRAAKKAGVNVQIKIERDGSMTLTPVKVVELSGTNEINEWDEIYNGKDHIAPR